MVTLHIDGKAVSWADAEELFADAAPTQTIEFRNAAGRVVAICRLIAEPDLVIEVTPKETARRHR